MGSSERAALADLAEDVGRALVRYAEQLRQTPSPAARVRSDTPKAAAAGTAAGPRGKRQQAVLALEQIRTTDGMTAAQVAEAVGVRQPNAYKLLTGLVDAKLLEKVPDSEPAAWRLPEAKRKGRG